MISSTNLTPDDVVDDDLDGVGLDVEVDGLLGLLLPVLPSISTPTVFSTGQQMLGTLLVKPHEYSERNFNFSLGDKLSSCCSEKWLKWILMLALEAFVNGHAWNVFLKRYFVWFYPNESESEQ